MLQKLRLCWLTSPVGTKLCKIITTSLSNAAPTSRLDCCFLSKGLGQLAPRVHRLGPSWAYLSCLWCPETLGCREWLVLDGERLSTTDMYHHTWLSEALSKEVTLIASLLESTGPWVLYLNSTADQNLYLSLWATLSSSRGCSKSFFSNWWQKMRPNVESSCF